MNKTDIRGTLVLFAQLSPKHQRTAQRNALTQGSRILVNNTRSNFRSVVSNPNSRSRFTGRTLISGIRYRVYMDTLSATVGLSGDFRLAFFEMGTHNRQTKLGYNRGNIKSHYFFRRARQISEPIISRNMEQILADSIKRTYDKYK